MSISRSFFLLLKIRTITVTKVQTIRAEVDTAIINATASSTGIRSKAASGDGGLLAIAVVTSCIVGEGAKNKVII